MPQEGHFFPYDPRGLRRALLGCAMASALLAAWTFARAASSGELLGFARGGILVLLLIAFGWFFWRVRARSSWGVRIDALGLTVSRPLSGEAWQLVWSQLSGVVREGARRERLALIVRPEGRLLLPRHLFATHEDFEALARALEQRLPRPHFDA